MSSKNICISLKPQTRPIRKLSDENAGPGPAILGGAEWVPSVPTGALAALRRGWVGRGSAGVSGYGDTSEACGPRGCVFLEKVT